MKPDRELGEAFATLLREPDAHQLGVCGKLGIPFRRHMEWMAGDAEPGSSLAQYQSAVLLALDDKRREDLREGWQRLQMCPGSKASATVNMWRHQHEARFRRFYEEPQKIELSGPGGGPIQNEDVGSMSPRDIKARILAEAAKIRGEDDEPDPTR